jgi:hypothetical protein
MLLFAPLLMVGEVFGQRLAGAVAPASVQVAIGSALFGLGMQLGGGCGSGPCTRLAAAASGWSRR